MIPNEKPRPIPIRLPQEIEDSLRFVASKTRSTLNSVVIDCLRENLPPVHPIELALLNGVSPFPKTERQLHSEALDRLNRYECHIQAQLGAILQIAAALNGQASFARKMQDSLLKGFDVRIPEDSLGNPPDFPSAEGTMSAKLLAYIDGSATIKNNEVLKTFRKQASRHQIEAGAEWEAVMELLGRLANAKSSGVES
jgi:hypothetical protein